MIKEGSILVAPSYREKTFYKLEVSHLYTIPPKALKVTVVYQKLHLIKAR